MPFVPLSTISKLCRTGSLRSAFILSHPLGQMGFPLTNGLRLASCLFEAKLCRKSISIKQDCRMYRLFVNKILSITEAILTKKSLDV